MPVVSTTSFTEKTFDYIIVGGGTTGISLAVRCVQLLDRYLYPLTDLDGSVCQKILTYRLACSRLAGMTQMSPKSIHLVIYT